MTTPSWWAKLQLRGLSAVCVSLIALRALLNRHRMSHHNGIVGRGRIRIVDDLAIPDTDFFRPGREFPCRLRHASISFMDDATMVVRGASLKFADADIDSPLDLLMNGGVTAPFWNMHTFAQFMFARVRGGRTHLIPYFRNNPRCFENVTIALRLRPSSFTQLNYHSQTPFEFRARDGRLRYCKFRLLPEDRGPETGIPQQADLRTPWFQEAAPGETLSPNYLKDEFRERVQRRGAKYHLEIQLHDWQAGDDRMVVLSSLYPWDETAHPWMPLATVDIDAIHEADPYGLRCMFQITNHPDCIQLIEPLSIYDPPSLEYLRVVGALAHRARLLGMRLFGPPQPVPDIRPPAFYRDEAASTVTAADIYSAACLPQHEPERSRRRRLRVQLLEQARGLYQFAPDDGLPAHARALPADEEFTADKYHRMLWDAAATVVTLGIGVVRKELDAARGLKGYDDLFAGATLPLPAVSARFASDEEFGRQRLDGVNPFLLRRCTVIPDNFPVEPQTVAALLPGGQDLAALRDAGRLYLLDLAILDGIAAAPGRFLCAPMCLFYVDGQSRLMPLAIQLGQSPATGPIFTPLDDPWLWRTAKTHVQCADSQVQQCVFHLLRTHMVMETIAVATHRQLSAAHPLHQLLMPHCRFTLAINRAARTKMIASGGQFDNLMGVGSAGGLALCAKAWKQWSFAQCDLRADLAARGVDDPALLPGYHYRDDALLVWDAIAGFVGAVLRQFYRSDADVTGDSELQAWVRELADPAIGNFRGLADPGGGLASLDRLVQVVTAIVFIATAQHSAANNGQYELYAYIPNVPAALFAPPPATKAPLSEESLVAALPPPAVIIEQITLAHVLSEPADPPLGRHPSDFFATNPEIAPIVARFDETLRGVAAQIDARNARLAVPYTYLHPATLCSSVET